MVDTNLTDARAELLRLERMAAHQRSVVAALEAQQTLQPIPALGAGPLEPEVISDLQTQGYAIRAIGLGDPDQRRTPALELWYSYTDQTGWGGHGPAA